MVYKNAEIKSLFLHGTGREGLEDFSDLVFWFIIIAITFSLKGER
jgi:hypothetical protein